MVLVFGNAPLDKVTDSLTSRKYRNYSQIFVYLTLIIMGYLS